MQIDCVHKCLVNEQGVTLSTNNVWYLVRQMNPFDIESWLRPNAVQCHHSPVVRVNAPPSPVSLSFLPIHIECGVCSAGLYGNPPASRPERRQRRRHPIARLEGILAAAASGLILRAMTELCYTEPRSGRSVERWCQHFTHHD